METQHPESDDVSPFVVQAEDAAAAVHDVIGEKQGRGGEVEHDDNTENFVSCPVEGCGEEILLTELEGHVEMHGEEGDFSSSASPDLEEGMLASTTERTGSVGKRIKLDSDYGSGYRESDARGKRDSAFGTKLSHALRNLEDVDLEVHQREDRSERKGQKSTQPSSQSAKSAWGKILRMPETNGRKGGTRRRSSSPVRDSGASSQKAVKRLGVSHIKDVLLMRC